MHLSSRLKEIPPSITVGITARAKEMRASGRDVISLGAGEPDFNTPAFICDLAIEALKNGETHYGMVPGTKEAREAIAYRMQKNGVNATPENIVVTAGGKHALGLALQSLIDPGKGQEVVVPVPAWVSYKPLILLAGGNMRAVETKAEDGFKPNPELIAQAITEKTRAIILNTPSNPCGTCWDLEYIKSLEKILKKFPDVAILSDEIYDSLVYGGKKHHSVGSIDTIANRTITLGGMSKSYAMTGWRLGWAHAPMLDGAISKAITTLQSQTTTCVSSFSIAAISKAIHEGDVHVEKMRKIFETRAAKASKLVSEWPGVSFLSPEAAFYIFPDISNLFGSRTPKGVLLKGSVSVAEAMLEEIEVAVVPGKAFGGCGDNHLRLSFACDENEFKEASLRIKGWINSLECP